MDLFSEMMREYQSQMSKGVINKAYKGLMDYIASLKNYLKKTYPAFHVSGIYYGYLDMTYFSFTPETLKNKNLKIAIVFLHESFRFEVWLAAGNKQVQEKYWESIKGKNWDKYHIVPSTANADAILEHTLVEDPDFGDLNRLTEIIEEGTLNFIQDVEAFLEL
jgi:hypothetical protein